MPLPWFRRPQLPGKRKRELRRRFGPKTHRGTSFKVGLDTYSIGDDGRFYVYGRTGIGGTRLLYVVGIPSVRGDVRERLVPTEPGHHPEFIRDSIEPHIAEHGQLPTEGIHLLVVFKRGAKRTSLLLPPVDEIK